MLKIKQHFTSGEASRLGGFKTASMVDYLCRTGIVRPSGRSEPGRGRHRYYTFGDVVLLRAISGLLASGLPVRRLKIALDLLRKTNFKGLREETVIAKYLITDGRKIWLRENPSALVDLTAEGQMAFAFVVDVQSARQQVIDEAQKQRSRYYVSA